MFPLEILGLAEIRFAVSLLRKPWIQYQPIYLRRRASRALDGYVCSVTYIVSCGFIDDFVDLDQRMTRLI